MNFVVPFMVCNIAIDLIVVDVMGSLGLFGTSC
jgi:hypothetical protein